MARQKKRKTKTVTKKKKTAVKAKKKTFQAIRRKQVKDLQTLKGSAAEKLRKAGYNTIAKLAQAQASKLAKEAGLNQHLAEKLISSARDSYKKLPPQQTVKESGTIQGQGQTAKNRLLQAAVKDQGFRRKIIHYTVKKLF
ncbi:MAG: helix-hairpin-helix domain-containing protein [Candidatus Omnitrophota bacterium]